MKDDVGLETIRESLLYQLPINIVANAEEAKTHLFSRNLYDAMNFLEEAHYQLKKYQDLFDKPNDAYEKGIADILSTKLDEVEILIKERIV